MTSKRDDVSESIRIICSVTLRDRVNFRINNIKCKTERFTILGTDNCQATVFFVFQTPRTDNLTSCKRNCIVMETNMQSTFVSENGPKIFNFLLGNRMSYLIHLSHKRLHNSRRNGWQKYGPRLANIWEHVFMFLDTFLGRIFIWLLDECRKSRNSEEHS